MPSTDSAYGLWALVVLNSAVFLLFAFSFFRPATGRDWRSFGAFAAFVVALFAEMYGFPLTLYFLAGWLQRLYPGLDPFNHDSGHLWHTLFGLQGDPHFSLLHILSNLMIVGGFVLLASAWHVLYQAQLNRRLATAGPYARLRHPQYAAFVLILFGFLLQWPTLLTLAMFPILLAMYGRLAKQEEAELLLRFGDDYRRYRERTPAFIPRWPSSRPANDRPH